MRPLRLACLTWMAVCCAVGDTATAEDMALRVQEALDTVNGDQYEKLVALGPEAVPAICDQLVVHEFPAVLVEVLGEFQDDRAALPLLEFLETHPDLADYTIAALKEIGDLRAEPALLDIVNDDSIPVSTRYEATVALARLGSPDMKAWAWKEILRIYKTRENVSHVVPLDGDVILEHDVTKGLCEVLTEEADREIAELLRHDNVNVGPLYKRAETRNRKWVVNAILHMAEHDGREEEGYEGRHTDYYQNVAALWSLHDLGGVAPTWRILEIMAKLERRHPELAAPMVGEDTSLDQVVTRFQQLKKTLLSEPTVKLYRHPMTRKEELLNYLWCYEFQYATITDYVTGKDQPLLVEMLGDPAYGKAWWNIPMVLGVLGEDEDAYKALLAYIQRRDRQDDDDGVFIWQNLNVSRRCDAVQWLPFLDRYAGAQLLIDIMTSREFAEDFINGGPLDQGDLTPRHVQAFEQQVAELRGRAALGLVLADRAEYTPHVQREFVRVHAVSLEHKMSNCADLGDEERAESELYHLLCYNLASALAIAEFLESHTTADYWAIDNRMRSMEFAKRAGEIIREANQARAAGEDSVAAANVP